MTSEPQQPDLGTSGEEENLEESEEGSARGRSDLWGWFWAAIATAAMYLLVWVTR